MTTASKITMVRVLMVPAFLVAFLLSPDYSWLTFLALGIFILASITDFIDGQVARRCNQTSDFGKFLDPLADKLLVISAMAVFCQWGNFPAWAFVIVLTREFAVTGLRLIAAGNGTVIAAGWSGKVKTFSTMVALCIWIVFRTAEPMNWMDWGLTAVIVVPTIYSGIEYFIRNWHCLGLNKAGKD